ncbi:hypothetical protein D3C72_2113190 [compost metagenome]
MKELIGDQRRPIGQPGHGLGIDVTHDDGNHAEIDGGLVEGRLRQHGLQQEAERRQPDQSVIHIGKADMADGVGVVQRQEHQPPFFTSP